MSKRIILIDDDPLENLNNERNINNAISNAKISIIDNGNDALQYLRNELSNPESEEKQIVIIDQNMPELSGIEVLEELEELVDLDPNKVEIYFLTGNNSVRLLEKSRTFDTIKGILPKPLTHEMIMDLLSNSQ